MFNVVVVTGRLTADPELKTTQSGKSVVCFTIANDIGYGENRRTNWLNIVAWSERAQFVSKYFSKGNMIGVRGEIQTRQWKDQNGNNRIATEIIASDIQFMEKKSDGGNYVNAGVSEHNTSSQNDINDDDLPF